MKRLSLALLLLASLSPPAVAADTDWRGPVIGKDVAAAEIHYALARAEAVHPNLYWHASRAEVSAREAALVATLPADARPMDEYLLLRELVGLFGDGHIHVSVPRRPGAAPGGGFLPLTVKPTPGGLRVVRSETAGIATGDTVTVVNGRTADQLFKRMTSLEPGEPEFQRELAETEFSWLLWELGVHAPFTLNGTFAGRAGAVTTPGLSRWNPLAQPAGAAAEDSLSLTSTPGPISVLTFRRMTDDPGAFWRTLQANFLIIRAKRPIGLIVDIRHNGGGNSYLGDELLNFFNDKPYRPFASETFKANAECRKTFSPEVYGKLGPVVRALRDGDSRTLSGPAEAPPSNRLRYKGPVAVLIGPGTFSSANILANAIGDYHLAELVGRDTAEIPNNYGMPCAIPLPHAEMTLYVPSAYFARANGDVSNTNDVHPDIAVPEPLSDHGPDPDIAAATAWIMTRPRPAAPASGNR